MAPIVIIIQSGESSDLKQVLDMIFEEHKTNMEGISEHINALEEKIEELEKVVQVKDS